MLIAIPLAGLVIGLYATWVVGFRLSLLAWLGTVAMIVGIHTYFWRDVYFPGLFAQDAEIGASAAGYGAIIFEVANRAQLGIATAFLLIVGICLSAILSKPKHLA